MSNNNLRDQFPGIAKTDRALNFAWGALETLGWLYMITLMFSGWYRLFTLRKKHLWQDEGMLWSARVLIIYTVLQIIALIIHTATHLQYSHADQAADPNYETWFNFCLFYPTTIMLSLIALGAPLLGLTWILNKVVLGWTYVKRLRKDNLDNEEVRFAKAQGWKIK